MRSLGSTILAAGSRVAKAAMVLAVAMWALVPATAADEGRVTVFAAASLKTSLDAVAEEWRLATGQKTVITYAASPSLAKQIVEGAPADVFISADLDWMDWLEQQGAVKPGTRRTLLGNHLVLIAPSGSPTNLSIGPGFPLAETLGNARLALAETSSVPAGKYAKAALIYLGVWETVQGKLAQAANVRAALNLVARGEAPLGVVYATDAIAEPKVSIVARFPTDSHPPIVYPAAVTIHAKSDAAEAFIAFLAAPQGRAIFERSGFTFPGTTRSE